MKHVSVNSALDLVTPKTESRLGFINYAIEKNYKAIPYIDDAKTFLYEASRADSADDLIKNPDLRESLLTAAGLSEKSLIHLTEGDKANALIQLKDKFLIPAGDKFAEIVVFLYLLNKGDALGGSIKNTVGFLAQRKFIRALISNINNQGIEYKWLDSRNSLWCNQNKDDIGKEKFMKAISWTIDGNDRTLAFNLTMSLLKQNTNLCLFACGPEKFNIDKITKCPEFTIMLGVLKGGNDPAVADLYWNAANTLLEKIRKAYAAKGLDIMTSFLGASIKNNMAYEIFDQLETGKLSNAINITNDKQLNLYCSWLLSL